jgi:hypothetical protein
MLKPNMVRANLMPSLPNNANKDFGLKEPDNSRLFWPIRQGMGLIHVNLLNNDWLSGLTPG